VYVGEMPWGTYTHSQFAVEGLNKVVSVKYYAYQYFTCAYSLVDKIFGTII